MPKLTLPDFDGNALIKHNFFMNLFDGGIFAFAMSLASQVTIFPVLIKKMGGTNLAVGLIPILWTAGFNFPQIFIANYTRTLPFKKKFILKTGMMQRLPWLFLSIITFFVINNVANDIGLILLLTFFTLSAIGGSMNLPGWFDMVSKITPVHLRGRLFAYRSILGGVLGILGGGIITYILSSLSYPGSFALLFLLAFLVTMVSYCFVASIKEKEPNIIEKKLSYREFVRRLAVIFRQDKNFRNFVIADALVNITLTADAFYTVNAIDGLSLPDSFAGIFTSVMMVSMIIGNLFFGYLADRYGHRINLLLASLFKIAACVIAFITPALGIYFLVFVFAAFTTSLLQISRLTMIAEICDKDDRPTYISFTNLLTAPFVLIGIGGGWLANSFGYRIIFVIAGISSIAASAWYYFMVKEPRKITAAGFN